MTVLVVLGSALALLALACWWEARRGRPAWGAHLGDEPPGSVAQAARSAKRGVAGIAVTGVVAGLDGGDG